MPWSCRFLENPPLAAFDREGKRSYYVDTKELHVGDMWFARDDDGEVVSVERRRGMNLSDFYWAHNAQRPPLMVLLPTQYSTGAGKQVFSVDGKCYNGQREYYDGWTVHGSPPAITIVPSINVVGSYHGFIQNGTVTEDCEGRRYDGLPRDRAAAPDPPKAVKVPLEEPTPAPPAPQRVPDAHAVYFRRPRR